ncbi:hypothetical protein [Treponema phagedenis]|uniref:hypothetical protein n=1 Tax=Treponema phagedenis TaxID=162 RepID=UPI0011E6D13D|nr:hypothetical protein [Treponema phagedenis]QEK00894.1 hypothetical protein FUT84_06760 [Treponema phagedenis]QEK05902.1 hypothetical protein FUT80_03665 [Treponema phagedenis]
MKFSKYNVFYEHGDNFLLVNTLTGALFTLDGELKQNAEKTSVVIGGINFDLYPKESEKIQVHVRRTMEILLSKNLIPKSEMQKLLTDENYCYDTIGNYFNFPKWTAKFTLLRNIEQGRLDDAGNPRYWKDPIGGYYICSQWYQSSSTKFAQWLIKLSKMDK